VASPSGPPAVGSLVLRHVVLLSVLPCCRGCAPPGSPAHPPAGDDRWHQGSAAPPSAACQRGRGHRGRASPCGQGSSQQRRCSSVVLAGRATSVPFAAVTTGPERTTTDNATSAPPAPFLANAGDDPARSGFASRESLGQGLDRPCRARQADPVPGRGRTGAPEASATGRDRSQPCSWWAWSVLGPHGIGNRWSSPGTRGHGRYARIAGHRAFMPTASKGKAGRGRVRAPHPTAAGPAAPANEAGGHRGRAFHAPDAVGRPRPNDGCNAGGSLVVCV
jgi:hypothetical protein